MKKLMILGASILQLPAIQKAKQMGVQVVAVDINPKAVGFQEEGVICETISTIDIDNILHAAKKHKIDGIMTLASDMPMKAVAAVANEMGLVGISETTALNTTNKVRMRRCLKKHNVPIPQFYQIKTKTEFNKIIEIFYNKRKKCIVKPSDNSGSRGVVLLEHLENPTLVEKVFDYSMQYSRNKEIVVEEYMEGPEVSVETININGTCNIIQITDKLTTGAPYFVEMGHSQPSVLSEKDQEKIAKTVCAAVNAVGIENGPSHTEVIVTNEGPKIVELGARLGGDNITTHLVPLSTGVDMVECCIHIALGEDADITKKLYKASAIRYLKTGLGTITDISGIERAEKIKGVQQICIVHGVGDKSSEIKNSINRIGFVISQANTPQKAIEICTNAIQNINIKVEKQND